MEITIVPFIGGRAGVGGGSVVRRQMATDGDSLLVKWTEICIEAIRASTDPACLFNCTL